MRDHLEFYVDGAWVPPIEARPFEVVDPATEKPFARISLGTAADVDRAVKAARRAFETWSRTTKEERLAVLRRIAAVYETHAEELAQTIREEMGAPIGLSRAAHVTTGVAHLMTTIATLEAYSFEEPRGSSRIVREPIGVCGLITPWNWPINQVACKVFPAIAAGCTVVLKPTELAPLNAILFARILDEAGLPPGVFNLVNGDGPGVGAAIAGHPDVDMVSFTGSTRAGIDVALKAAPSVKRVAQELGGKSANLLLDDADFGAAVSGGVAGCFINSGQTCSAPTRMFVPASRHAEAVAIATATAAAFVVGDPTSDATTLGPVVSAAQYEKIQRLIRAGIDEGATLVVGGLGRPDGLDTGYFVRPTVFAGVTPGMTVAREEIFGPVLVILPYESEEDAIRLANDTPYGLAAYVSSGDLDRARAVGSRLRAGSVFLNGAQLAFDAPFGGYRQSGNGREWGVEGFEEFLETKSMVGWSPA